MVVLHKINNFQIIPINPEEVDAVGNALVNIVSSLNVPAEQTRDNLNIISEVFESINDLIQSGLVNISEDVSESK